MTLFPDSVDAMLNVSILGRAQQRGYISIQSHQIRQYTTNRQMQVDDYPYGGGRGAVMQADPLYRCWSHIVETYGPGRTIFLSPCGRTFTQEVAKELKARYDHLILVCGHYEGVDQRFLDECVDEEISIGDFVLTGGELAAILAAALGKNPRVRQCVRAIALATLSAAAAAFAARGLEAQVTQIWAARSKGAGGLNLMMGQNPVWLISGRRREEEA